MAQTKSYVTSEQRARSEQLIREFRQACDQMDDLAIVTFAASVARADNPKQHSVGAIDYLIERLEVVRTNLVYDSGAPPSADRDADLALGALQLLRDSLRPPYRQTEQYRDYGIITWKAALKMLDRIDDYEMPVALLPSGFELWRGLVWYAGGELSFTVTGRSRDDCSYFCRQFVDDHLSDQANERASGGH